MQSQMGAVEPLANPSASGSSTGRRLRKAFRLVRGYPLGALGLAVVLLMFLVAIFAPLIATHPVDQGSGDAILLPPSGEHFFGTDEYGRDVFSRVVYGARVSLYIGFGSVAVGMVAALLLGMISAYAGGFVDTVFQRFIDAAMAFPPLVFLLVLASVFGSGVWQLILALGILGAFRNTRVIRAAVLSVASTQYVEAARVLGASNTRILLRHVLPNIFGPTMVVATVWLGVAIISESSLSYLGLGIQPPTPSWGRMLSDLRPFMLQVPAVVMFPGIAIAVTVFAFNVLGDALRDILDPRMRGAR